MDILILDDNEVNVALLANLARKLNNCETHRFSQPLKALEWCKQNNVDLMLIDYMMPEMNGVQFIRTIRSIAGLGEVPIIMVTANDERSVRYDALNAGANDFLTKPIDSIEFVTRSKNLLALRQHAKHLADQAGWLREEVAKATSELIRREQETLLHLGKAAEFRDPETGAHILRMSHYAKSVAAAMGLSKEDQQLILYAAPMHDIGKLGTPDNILLKPGKLTPEEFELMKLHATHGWEILRHGKSPSIQAAALIAYSHHEKWDGSGYPQGLKGDTIPLFGRIVAVADVFDALTSERPYKKAWPDEEACNYLREQSGKHFDPACIQAFFEIWDEILKIKNLYRDDDPTINTPKPFATPTTEALAESTN